MGFDLNGLAPKGALIPRPKRPEPEVVGKDKWQYDKELEEYHNKYANGKSNQELILEIMFGGGTFS